MIKKCLIISLIYIMTINLVACGAKGSEQKSSEQSETEQKQEVALSTVPPSSSADLIKMESERKYERTYTQPEKEKEPQKTNVAQDESVKKNEKQKEQETKGQEQTGENQPVTNNQQKRISNSGYNYRFKNSSQEAECRGIAAGIAQMIAAQSDDPWEQIDILARYMNSTYVASITESTEGNYDNPYGVFVEHVGTCAGVTRATGMVLDALGIRWTHANPNQWTHQWNIVEIDGEIGYCDSSMYGRSGKGNLVV